MTKQELQYQVKRLEGIGYPLTDAQKNELVLEAKKSGAGDTWIYTIIGVSISVFIKHDADCNYDDMMVYLKNNIKWASEIMGAI